MSNQASEFAYVCELVKNAAAIALDAQREYLLSSRLAPVAQREGFSSISEMISRLRAQKGGDLHWKVVEAMTTNETSFFRDLRPFEALRKAVIPTLINSRKVEQKLTIWCAASSSGQEPYSICMLLREHFPFLQHWKVQIIASDIANAMLEKAQQGCYSQLEVNRGLPATLLVKYFEKQSGQWQIREDVRKMVEFRRINLANPLPAMPPLDVVFLRNVMIYFPVETKKAILANIRKVLRPDGFLFLGTAETTINLDPNYHSETYENVSYYRTSPPKEPGLKQ